MDTPFMYVESDIPEGVTLTDWRRSQVTRTGRRSLWRRLLAL